MARARTVFACTECGAQQPRWLGRCPSCGAWSSLVEEPAFAEAPRSGRAGGTRGGDGPADRPRALHEIGAERVARLESGIPELDRVLGGGLAPGCVVLLGGEPGIGKSTLALQLAARVQAGGRPVLYVSGEESPEQVRLRAERIGGVPGELLVQSELRVEALLETWAALRPALAIVDSVQTVRTERVDSAPGSVAQVRESAALLAGAAKAQGTALALIGHVTKEGTLAGPRVLEHLVDAVLTLEGDRSHAFRLLRATKNRFGSTSEVGVFTMADTGLACVDNPSELLLAERRAEAPGSCIVPLLEGTRPMLVEIQALVAPAGYATARRTCIGIDDARVALLLAVLDRRAGIDLVSTDVYVNVTGGVRVFEPAADLGVALAIASSRLDLPLPPDAAACGELGLGGEVRRVGRVEARVREAARLGFRRVLLPKGACGAERGAPARDPAGELVGVDDVAGAVAWLRASSSGNAGVNHR